ncbi:MAG: aldo/keto reductase [Fimbriimonadaceae bacterium]|nr:aldo/keto reductase [Fimbriimonadaceae bacterium]
MELDRRQFVGSLVAGAAAAGLGRAQDNAPPTSPTATVPLGKSGVRCSFVGLGTGVRGWQQQSNATRMGIAKFTQIVRHCYDQGVRLFDVADLYGTHSFLKQALAGLPRDSYTIQSKIWFRPEGMPAPVTDATAAVERFLQELGTDYIDTLLLHCTVQSGWVDDLAVLRDQLTKCRERGLIRAHGTSCHSFPALQSAAGSDWVQVQLARVNHKRVLMDHSPEAIAEHLRAMRAAGRGVIGMKLFGEGRFKTVEDREASLRFVLQQRCLDAMVIGFEETSHVDETLALLQRLLAT